MDDSKINELRLIHKDLAACLNNQHEVMSNSILAISAIRTALESNPDLQKAYWASHRALSEDGTFQASQDYENARQKLLKRLADW